MIEDTKDKVRRNLVLFCLILIISKYLEIDPLGVILKAVGVTIKQENLKNLQVVVISTFSYFTYRFVSSDQFQTDLMNLYQAISDHFTRRMTEFRDDLIKKALYNPSAYIGLIKFPSMNANIFFTETVSITQLVTAFPIGKPTPSLTWQFLGMTEYRATLKIYHPSTSSIPIYKQMFNDGYTTDSANGAEHQFQLVLGIFYPWTKKIPCLISGMRKGLFSQEFSEAMIPLFLVIWAAITSLNKA